MVVVADAPVVYAASRKYHYELPVYFIYERRQPQAATLPDIEPLTLRKMVNLRYRATVTHVLFLFQISLGVSAHGWVSQATINGVNYPGYNPYQDPFDPSAKPKIFRKIPWNGPVEDLSLPDIQCSGRFSSGTSPAPLHAPVEAGTDISLYWTQWPDSHHGPLITYLARCPDSCDDYQPGTE